MAVGFNINKSSSASAESAARTSPRKRRMAATVCAGCGVGFSAAITEIKRGNGKFCSRLCQRRTQATANAALLRSDTPKPERQKRWRERVGAAVHRAHNAVEQALASGALVREPCEICGVEKTDAHHDDYSAPLAVRWLCRKHHLEHHRAKPGPHSLSPVSP